MSMRICTGSDRDAAWKDAPLHQSILVRIDDDPDPPVDGSRSGSRGDWIRPRWLIARKR